MNERIKELAREAGFYANPDVEKFEKFAELLIRECAKWMSDGNIPDGFYEAGRMLEHFGVEE